jgi:uncharacterized protein YfaS (alpha-2-macroglobulin family)
MRKPLMMLIVFGLPLLALFGVFRAYSVGERIAPQVISATPTRGEELALNGTVRLDFDRPMDQSSVESAFKVSPAVAGTFTWQGEQSITFKPSEPLQRATEYTFTLENTAASSLGVPLKDTYTLKLRTLGFLRVAQVLPANGTKDIDDKPTITIIFNRPVVPLMTPADMAKLPNLLTIVPETEGEGAWLTTSIYTFKPKALQGGTTYTVTVSKGLTDVSGSILPEDYSFTFSTVAPKNIEILPENGQTKIPRDYEISAAFSQPMDTAATESAFSLIGPDGIAVPGSFKWGNDNQRMAFVPAQLLDYETTYTVKIDRIRARSANGGLLPKDVQTEFTTISAPDIAGTNPPDGSAVEASTNFTVFFTGPMKLDEFKSRITIDPKPKSDDYDTDKDEKGFFFKFNFGPEPSTSYTLTLDTNGLVDRYNTPIRLNSRNKAYRIVAPGKVQIKFVTDALPPSASLKTGSEIGLYSAYRADTRVYTLHRNISAISLSLASVPLGDFLKMASSNGGGVRANYKINSSNFIRRWTVPVYNPPNALRYDLLTVGEDGASVGQKNNVQCLDAAPPRLDIGQKVVVLKDDGERFRLRDSAGMQDSVIVAQLDAGTELSVIDGPICADKFVWWKLRSSDGTINGWGAEGDRVKYFIGPKDAPTAVPSVFASNTHNALRPGAYWLDFSSPDLPNSARRISHVMLVATANVTLKLTPKVALAWVTDLQSGQPVSGVNVQLYTGADAKVTGKPVKTDENGLASIPLPDTLNSLYNNVFAVVNDGGNLGVAVSNWDGGIRPDDFGQQADYRPENVTVYLYSDRSLYRPGQPVYYRGVLRSRDDMQYGLSDYKKVSVEVYDPNGRSLSKSDITVNSFGTFSGSFNIDPHGALGNYRIYARLASKDPNGVRPEFVREVTVAEYRVPEFQVKLDAAEDQVIQGSRIKVKVDSSYFFGGPVSHARIEWLARTDNYFFTYGGRYRFYDYNEDVGYTANGTDYNHTVGSGKGETDDQGAFIIDLPADLGKARQSQRFTIEARVVDESDRLVAGTVTVIVHQGEFYIGATPEEYVGAAGQPQKVDLITVDWNRKPMPKTDLSVRVVERVWRSVQAVEPGTGKVVWQYDVSENPIASDVVHTDAEGKAVYEFTPPHGGAYKIYATSRDTHGNQITTSTFAWIAGPDYVPWRQQNSNRIDLKIDRDNYNVGDTASILIASPFQGQTTALVTVERGGILKTEVVTLATNSTVYKLPITPNMAPNAYVSVTIVKGVDAKTPTASFRMGLVQLGVNPEQLQLKIKVTPDKEKAGPREKVTYKLHVTNYNGEPAKAEIGVGLTDLAVLSLMPDTSTPILQHFYGQQSLTVRTANALILNVDQQTQEVLNVVKGGGGGGPEGGILEVRQQFVDTPLWKPSILTDNNGDATLDVVLPDNLTTWRLDVRAVTLPTDELKTTLVGQTTFDLISSKPLLIRPITPRFYTMGDVGTLAAIVNNNTDQVQEVTASIDVKGLTLKGNANQTLKIPARGRVRYEWPIEVQDVDSVSVIFTAKTTDGKYADAARSAAGEGEDKTLPVRRYTSPDKVTASGLIGKEGGQSVEGIVLPKNTNVQRGSLDIEVSPSLAASTTSALKVLENYPHQCVEQTVSKFLPNLMTYRAFKELSLADDKMYIALDKSIREALQRLYNEQHSDGGWGWFVQEDSSTQTTAYTVIALSEAQKQGFNIDGSTLGKAITFLQRKLEELNKSPGLAELNRQAFVLYALAYGGKGDFSRSVRLYQYRKNLSLYAQALLAMDFDLMRSDSSSYVQALVDLITNRAEVTATGAHWSETQDDLFNWNTDTRTTAIILKALIQVQPESLLLPNVVRWLMSARQGAAWETTQETAWSVMALTDWMKKNAELKPNYTFDVLLNGKALLSDGKANPENVRQPSYLFVQVKDLLTDQANRLTFERTGGDGTLYYTANLYAYLPIEQTKALTRGISLTRAYSLVNDKDHKPITQAKVGDNIRVTLTIVAPEDLHYVVITDPIPAGTEAVDPNLPTTGTIGEAPKLSSADPLSRGWGWWWFSKTELRDDRVVMYASYLPKGTYQYTYTIRAGLSGEYRVIPATGEEFYSPLVYGRSDGAVFTITN